MNYQAHYDNLIATRRLRVPEPGAYYETHHVVMKSMGGSDDPENLVKLTAREHFLAHWLLWRIHRNRQTAHAFFTMSNYKNRKRQGKERSFSSRGYAEAKEAHAKHTKERMTGRVVSDATRLAISEHARQNWSKKTQFEKSSRMKFARGQMTSSQCSDRSQKANLSFTSERRSAVAKAIWQAYSTEDLVAIKQKRSSDRTSYWAKLSPEAKAERMRKLNVAKKNKRAA